ncbi:MAG: MFS transporter [Saprospiraceae bacterium]
MGIFVLGILTFIILYGAFLTYIPFVISDKFGYGSGKIGLILSLSSVMTAIVASQVGRISGKFGSVNVLKFAFLLYMLVSFAIPFINSIFIFLIPILLFGTAQALNFPNLQTMLANLAPDNQRGIFMSLNGMNLRIGQTIGPLIIGLGFSYGGLKGAYFLSAIVAILGLFILFTMHYKKKG